MTVEKEHIIKLRLTDFDCHKRLTPTAVLDIFQDLATEQASEVGIGLEDLEAKGLIWAVVRQKIEIVGSAVPHQEVKVKTWPHSPTRLAFLRDYSLRDMQGNLIAKGTSEWVMLDIENRKFANVLENYPGPTNFNEERSFEGKLRKIKDIEMPDEPALVVTPRFSDYDTNMHMNNAKYITYIVDAIPQHADAHLRTLQIDYRKEVAGTGNLNIYACEDELGWHVIGKNAEGATAFSSLLVYE